MQENNKLESRYAEFSLERALSQIRNIARDNILVSCYSTRTAAVLLLLIVLQQYVLVH